MNFIAGIDEAGRGPLAGPVAVGIFVAPRDFNFSLLEGLADSKKISTKNREKIFKQIQELKRHKKINFFVTLVSPSVIDLKGISFAIKKGIRNCISKTKINSDDTFMYLDGGLKAPDDFKQETVIKGDAKIPAISAASICAKVVRDMEMINLSKKYKKYFFDTHKGYGTREHVKILKEIGPSNIHRKSFLKSIL